MNLEKEVEEAKRRVRIHIDDIFHSIMRKRVIDWCNKIGPEEYERHIMNLIKLK